MIKEKPFLSDILPIPGPPEFSLFLEKKGNSLRVVDSLHTHLLQGFSSAQTSLLSERRTGFKPEISLEIFNQKPTSFVCKTEITNTSPFPLVLENISVLKIPEGFKTLPPENLSVYTTPWQSWSEAGGKKFLSEVKPQKQTEKNKKHPDFPDGFIPNYTILDDEKGNAMLLGFTTANHFQSGIKTSITPQSHALDTVCLTEKKVLMPSQTLPSEELFVAFGKNPQDVLEQYQQELKEKHHPPKMEKPLTGWCSWYEHFENVNEQVILSNLQKIVAEKLPIDVIQIDDGYQTGIGDWAVDTKKFPHDLKPIVEAIHTQDKKAGIWWSPFLVGETSQIFKQHPEWVVKDTTTGAPLLARRNWNQDIYILDSTHPEVQEHIRKLTRQYTKDWGFDYLKLDFLYAGAMEGIRYDKNATSLESYKKLLTIIKEEAENTILVGCGAPFLPTAGLLHAMRISSDTEFVWKDTPNEWKDEPGIAKNVLQPLFERQWMHNTLWANDPDIITIRNNMSSLTTAEKQLLTTAILLSGGSLFIGDDIEKLDDQERALLHRIFPSTAYCGIQANTEINHFPESQTISTKDGVITALYNWADIPQKISFTPQTPRHIYETWTNTYHGISESMLSFEIPPHGVKLLRTKKVKTSPHVIATTNHLLADVVDIMKEQWDGSTLTITQNPQTFGKGDILLHIPEGFTIHTDIPFRQKDNLLTVSTKGLPQSFSLSFQKTNE